MCILNKMLSAVLLVATITFSLKSFSQSAQVPIGDDPVKGDPYAPVVIVEFSDFQCHFCKKFSKTTLKEIEKNYINTGIARLVFKDFPLFIHQFAFLAAQSANCVIKTGKYWEMNEALFSAEALDPLLLENLAKKFGLTHEDYENCINSKSILNEINNDIKEGKSAGVKGTPSFIIGNEVREGIVEGELIAGAQPYETFSKAIEKYANLIRIYFETASYKIQKKYRALLKKFAVYLKKHPEFRLKIEGHTDERGSKEYNMILGRKRALAVKNFLSSVGIEPERMKVTSYGETRPLDPNPTESAYAKNRRVEIVIIK